MTTIKRVPVPRIACKDLCVLLVVLALSCQTAYCKGLQSSHIFPAGRTLSGMVLQDFNNDGHLDLLFIENPTAGLANTIHVLLGNGDGTFQSASIDTIAGVNLSAVVAGDFDADGTLDIAVTDSDAMTLTIFTGKGDGHFESKQSLPTGVGPVAMATADMNGDGKIDIVLINNADNTVTVYLGNGDATLTLKGTFSSGSGGPIGLAVGDFDNDGKPDVAVTLNANALSVLRGNGDGTLGNPNTSSILGVNPNGAIATVDLNGDGKLDLIITTDKVEYFRGNGDLTFQNPILLDAQTRPSSIVVADMNNDGHPDLVIGNNFSNSITVFLNDGFGGITSVQNFSVLTWPIALGVGDLNGDGKLDVVAIGGAPTGAFGKSSYQVVLGNGDGSMRGAFTYTFTSAPGAGSTFGGVVADFNHDGKPDIAVADALNRVTLLQNTGNFKFALTLPTIPVTTGGNLVSADVNGDGNEDLVTTGSFDNSAPFRGITTLLGNGSGQFQPVLTPSQAAGNSYIAVADLNGDGKVDLVFAPGNNSTSIGVMFGNGDGSFQPLLPQDTYPAGAGPNSVIIADFNGDGKPDIAVGNGGNGSTSTVNIFLGNGLGAFTPVAEQPAIGAFPYHMIAVADLNKDGVTDLIVGNTGNGNPGSVSVLIGKGNGTFKPALTLPAQWRAESLTVGDFNADGFPDIVVGENGGLLELFTNIGNGTFAPPIALSAGGGATSLWAVDMNNGGVPDLVAISSEAIILPNTGGTRILMSSSANPTTFKQPVTISATITPNVPGMPPVSGTVQLTSGIDFGTFNLPGTGAFSTSAFSAGTHAITAAYSGDENYFARTLLPLSQVVNKALTTTVVTSSAASSIVGVAVTFSASISSTAGGSITGTASLRDGTNTIATTALDATGHASFNISNLAAGTHNLRVSYSGDGSYVSSTSAVLVENSIDFNVTLLRPSRPKRGAVAQAPESTFQLRVDATGVDTQTVHLACSGLPVGTTCRFNAQDFVPDGARLIDVSIEGQPQPNRSKRLKSTKASTPYGVTVTAALGELTKSVIVSIP